MTSVNYKLFVANWVCQGEPTAEDLDAFLTTGEWPAGIEPAPDLHGLGELAENITGIAAIVKAYDTRKIERNEAIRRLESVFVGGEDERKENAIALCLHIDEHQAIAWLRDFKSPATTIGYITRRYQTRAEYERFAKRIAKRENATITWIDA